MLPPTLPSSFLHSQLAATMASLLLAACRACPAPWTASRLCSLTWVVQTARPIPCEWSCVACLFVLLPLLSDEGLHLTCARCVQAESFEGGSDAGSIGTCHSVCCGLHF